MYSTLVTTQLNQKNTDILYEYFSEIEPIFSGFIPSADVALLQDVLQVSERELMSMLLYFPIKHDVIPVDGFEVSALCKGSSGNLYYGLTIEIPNGDHDPILVHGVQSAITTAIQHGDTGIESMMLPERPCSFCVLFMAELTTAKDLVVFVGNNDGIKLPELLAGNQLVSLDHSLMNENEHELELSYPTEDDVINRAYGEAMRAYSPYSNSYCGVAIQTNDGEVYGGTYAENAAVNPGLSPLESALVNLLMCGGEVKLIKRIVMVEALGVIESKMSANRNMAKAIAPEVRMEFYNACKVVRS